MLNKKYILLIYLLLYNNTIFGINMKKEDVLKIDILKYKSKEECPEYSFGYDENNKHCQFRFLCRNENCSTVDDKGHISLPNKEGKMEDLNANTYSNIVFKDSNEKFKCSSDSECFTNNCSNSTCIIKNNSPVTECRDYYYYKSYLFIYKAKMNCGLGEYEHCHENDDCGSKLCSKINNYKLCSSDNYKDISKERLYDIIMKIGGFILVFIFYNFVEWVKEKRRKSKKAKKARETKAETETETETERNVIPAITTADITTMSV